TFVISEGEIKPFIITVTGGGQPVPGVTVGFSVDDPTKVILSAAAAVTGADGRVVLNVTGGKNGSTTIRASVLALGSIEESVTVIGISPMITSVPVLEVAAGSTYNYDVDATDPNGDALTYSLLSAPAGMVIDPNTGVITWTPPVGQPQTGNDVTVQASDPAGHTDTQSFSIYIIVDADNDTYDNRVDCDDADPFVNPGAAEIPYDGIDNDCSTTTPDDDLDYDGFLKAADCDDTDPAVNPNAAEIVYNGIDDDCNSATLDYIDADGDGYLSQQTADYPNPADCDDGNPYLSPGAKEIPQNGIDDDCNAATPDNWSKSFILGIDDSSWIYYAKSHGGGTFSNYETVWQLGGGNARGIVIEDFDGDGDLDFIAGRSVNPTAYYYLFINDGADNFVNTGLVGT
ncbi:MAG: putative Ig domain-containing protein, partial [Geobacter sp.]|nr:putative Ig domain-containing protein [Geobacter sp.]